MQTLQELKKHFINELVHQDLRRVFYILRQNIDNQCVKYDDLNLLHARYITASHDQNIKGTLSSEDARLIFNRLNAILLDFINDLTDKDLNLESSAAPVSIPTQVKDIAQKTTCNKGKILYKVPSIMELKKERKCIVRIAFDEKELEINDLTKEGSKVEPIRIAEVMQVQFIDQCTDEAFNIRSISSSEQLVDRGDFTEWIFYVEPLLQGVYDLLLKVSVIEKRLGREIRKDIVLEKKIEVVANPVEVNDHLEVYTQEENKMAIGAGFAIPSGFEVWDQPVILDSFFLPPLDPGANPPPPTPPPYLPVNEASSLGWLAFATIALIGLVVHFNKDPHELKIDYRIEEELILNVSGKNPPLEFILTKERLVPNERFPETSNFEKPDSINYSFRHLGLTPNKKVRLMATLIDKNKKQIDTSFIVEWKRPIKNNLKIKATTSNEENDLNLNISHGTYPFKISIINNNNKIKIWEFPLFHTNDIPISLPSLAFPKEGNFMAKVVDAKNKMDSTIFSLKGPDFLILKTSEIKNNKTLRIKLKGNRPPFKVFLDQDEITSLENDGNHSLKFSEKIIKGKRKVRVKITDALGKSKTKLVKISTGISGLPVNPKKLPDTFFDPIIIGNKCVDPEKYKDRCAVIYIFKEKTPDNWKMNSQTFSNSKIKQRIKNEKFEDLKFNLNNRKNDCNNFLFSNLNDANTFVFQGNNKAPISYKGFVDSKQLLSSLICLDNPPPPVIVPPILTEKGIRKSLLIQLDSVKTYKYHSLKGDNISIEKQQIEKYRVQIITFSKEYVFDKFIEDIENKKDIKQPLFIRLEKDLIKVYLGNFDKESEAEELLKELSRYLKKEKIVPDDEYIKFMKVLKN